MYDIDSSVWIHVSMWTGFIVECRAKKNWRAEGAERRLPRDPTKGPVHMLGKKCMYVLLTDTWTTLNQPTRIFPIVWNFSDWRSNVELNWGIALIGKQNIKSTYLLKHWLTVAFIESKPKNSPCKQIICWFFVVVYNRPFCIWKNISFENEF